MGRARANVAESLHKGDRVVVVGRLRQRDYETRDGEKRSTHELDVDEIGASLHYATADVRKATPTARPAATTSRTTSRRPSPHQLPGPAPEGKP